MAEILRDVGVKLSGSTRSARRENARPAWLWFVVGARLRSIAVHPSICRQIARI
ncbi:hypothetical protein H8S47_06025 [Sphingomonas sp. DOAB1063]|uniref:Uncharacterized protein n=1 Tax=Sphingomonas albertensis TaxID=2762591 RepID=A0ABR7ALA4_9SPHN|nr:hypothetical protein [Sphingomonas albertensis]